MTNRLTDAEYDAALGELTAFEKAIREADRLSQENTLDRAATLDRLFRDDRWIVERNAERAMTGKTPQGVRGVDPASRSQFSTWVRGRFASIDPSTTYRLLDAQNILQTFFRHGEKRPATEAALRPLKKLTKAAYGSGKRIGPIWELACHIAEGQGRSEPNAVDVRHAISEWNKEHIPATQARRESRLERAERARIRAISAWKAFVELANKDQINSVIEVIEHDIESIEATGRP